MRSVSGLVAKLLKQWSARFVAGWMTQALELERIGSIGAGANR